MPRKTLAQVQAIIFLASFTLTGCSLTRGSSSQSSPAPPASSWLWCSVGGSSTWSFAWSRECSFERADQELAAGNDKLAFQEMLVGCRSVLDEYRKDSIRLTWGVVLLAVVGAASGGIAVPALSAASHAGNKAWIDALSGVSE